MFKIAVAKTLMSPFEANAVLEETPVRQPPDSPRHESRKQTKRRGRSVMRCQSFQCVEVSAIHSGMTQMVALPPMSTHAGPGTQTCGSTVCGDCDVEEA